MLLGGLELRRFPVYCRLEPHLSYCPQCDVEVLRIGLDIPARDRSADGHLRMAFEFTRRDGRRRSQNGIGQLAVEVTQLHGPHHVREDSCRHRGTLPLGWLGNLDDVHAGQDGRGDAGRAVGCGHPADVGGIEEHTGEAFIFELRRAFFFE